MTKNAFDSRRWVLPVVSIIPILAIAFAFSLGPSPRKRLQVVYQAEKVDPAKLDELASLGQPLFQALVEDVQQPDVPHRAALIGFLGDRKHQAAAPVLRRLASAPLEPAAVRMASFKALRQIDPKGVRELAQSLREEAGPLGQAARAMLAELSSDQS
ncbi:MAG: HEAT repeat domain-containing protein [Myxococcota bacterium]